MTGSIILDDIDRIKAMTLSYFEGLHQGDTQRLRSLFHTDVVLKAPGLRRTLDEWLELIPKRPIPKTEGHAFNYRILAIDVEGNQAMVKVFCPLLGHHYVDFLGFLKEAENWKIVSKMYADT